MIRHASIPPPPRPRLDAEGEGLDPGRQPLHAGVLAYSRERQGAFTTERAASRETVPVPSPPLGVSSFGSAQTARVNRPNLGASRAFLVHTSLGPR